MGRKIESESLVELVCPVCGKRFIKSPMHVYKEKDAHGHVRAVCSWGCLCKYRREIEALKAEQRAAKARAKA